MRFGREHGLGDLSTDFSQFTSDLTGGNYPQAFGDPVLGIPVWVWGIFVFVVVDWIAPDKKSGKRAFS